MLRCTGGGSLAIEAGTGGGKTVASTEGLVLQLLARVLIRLLSDLWKSAAMKEDCPVK